MQIKEITIKTTEKKFEYWYSDSKIKNKKEELIKEREKFIANNLIKEVNKEFGLGTNIVKYYSGSIEFDSTNTEQGSITLDIKPTKELMQMIIAMCLKNVVDVCDQQNKQFKTMFQDFVKNNCLKSENELLKIK